MKKMMGMMVLVVTCLLVAGGVYAQFAKPEDAIKYRKSVMFMIAQHFKRMGAVVQGKRDYDQQTFAANAEVVKMLATLPWEAALEPGTDKGDTTQSPAVFAKSADFEKQTQVFEMATAKLAAASQSADMKALKTEFGMVAKSCKACHSQFRTK
jgi:cytochrome c556